MACVCVPSVKLKCSFFLLLLLQKEEREKKSIKRIKPASAENKGRAGLDEGNGKKGLSEPSKGRFADKNKMEFARGRLFAISVDFFFCCLKLLFHELCPLSLSLSVSTLNSDDMADLQATCDSTYPDNEKKKQPGEKKKLV